ncbi:uncharacterized protein IUM83_07902 [Phytophthora cinnamomi]|uniref:uncharacterized protein n=1 Tax=Phytophthora cinnamomi TaxID=4785 RepID=UPI0035593A92|nr:hypothetical protein IUM83_07902 [Phytophthora cinnamomi]
MVSMSSVSGARCWPLSVLASVVHSCVVPVPDETRINRLGVSQRLRIRMKGSACAAAFERAVKLNSYFLAPTK